MTRTRGSRATSHRSRRGFVLIVSLLLSFLTTSGCAIVDLYGPRVDVYNQEAEASRNRLLLLNIIRSAHGEPLQWSSLNQVLGSASASGTFGASIPIIGRLPATGSLLYNLSPMVSTNGGPTFTVPLLDTKEFQTGIITPVTPATIKTFVDEGYPLEAILPLVLSAIEFSPPGGGTYRIENDDQQADSPQAQFWAFQRFAIVVRQLIDKGLTIEAVGMPVGVLLLRKDIQNPKTISDAIAGGLEIKEYNLGGEPKDPYLTTEDLKYLHDQKQTNYFRAFKTVRNFRFCFDKLKFYKQQHPKAIVLQPSELTDRKLSFFGRNLEERPEATIIIPADLVCGYRGARVPSRERIEFNVRSTEGTVVYLGKLARLQLGLDDNAPLPSIKVDKDPRGADKFDLFTVQRGTLQGPSITTALDGDTYSVPVRGGKTDLSSRVITLLGEMVTLNNSAKDLPPPNVISVVAP